MFFRLIVHFVKPLFSCTVSSLQSERTVNQRKKWYTNCYRFQGLYLKFFVWTLDFSGTNDAFVTISLGKEKFQTSVKQKALSELEWQEECEL